MIKINEIKKIVNDYSDVRIGVLGSHSALEIMDGAKDEELSTVVYCQKGREEPYKRFGRIADEIIVLKKFKDMVSAQNQKTIDDIVNHGIGKCLDQFDIEHDLYPRWGCF